MITIYLYEKPPDQILTLFARLSSSPFLKKVAPKIPILISIPRCFRGFAPTTTVPPSFMGQRSVGSALHKPFTSVFLRVGNDGGIFGCLSTCSEIAFVETTKNICTYLHNRDVDCWCEIIVFVRNMLQAKNMIRCKLVLMMQTGFTKTPNFQHLLGTMLGSPLGWYPPWPVYREGAGSSK